MISVSRREGSFTVLISRPFRSCSAGTYRPTAQTTAAIMGSTHTRDASQASRIFP